MSVTRASEAPNDRAMMVQRAFWLEYLTIAWMIIEAAVAIGSGIAAESLALLAFGIDSLIELASAGVLVWRLTVELRHGQAFARRRERPLVSAAPCCLHSLPMSSRAPAGNYGRNKAPSSRCRASPSVCSPFRSCTTCHAASFRSPMLSAVESITCGWLAFVVVGALVAQLLVGAWWVDPLASLGIVWFLIREGREAWEGEDCCDDH